MSRTSSKTIDERFWEKVDKQSGADDCWLWLGHISKNGYGQITFNNKTYKAHRFSYQISVGEIPNGLQLDHLCRTRNCVNPAHLEPVEQAENIRRGISPTSINAQKTHCHKGHEFTEENTYIKQGYRQCRKCKAEEAAIYYKNHKERISKCKSEKRKQKINSGAAQTAE